MIPTSTKQSKPKLCRALRALANEHFLNRRNGTDDAVPVPVSQDTGRPKRKRRRASSQPGDETVIRILGSDSDTAKISTATPEKVKVVVETVEDKEIDIPI